MSGGSKKSKMHCGKRFGSFSNCGMTNETMAWPPQSRKWMDNTAAGRPTSAWHRRYLINNNPTKLGENPFMPQVILYTHGRVETMPRSQHVGKPVCKCGHLQCRLPALLHVQMSSLYALVVGEVHPFWEVFFEVRPHRLVRGPALQTRHRGGESKRCRREQWVCVAWS